MSGSKAAVSVFVVGQLGRPLAGQEMLLSEKTTQHMTLPVHKDGVSSMDSEYLRLVPSPATRPGGQRGVPSITRR
jgi:hypothetical protein